MNTVELIRTQFTHQGVDGDFAHMVNDPKYDGALFVYPENVYQLLKNTTKPGSGAAIIRPYSRASGLSIPRAVGIVTGWTPITGGFRQLEDSEKHMIDLGIQRLRRTLIDNPTYYTSIIISVDPMNPTLFGGSIFADTIGNDVILYITAQLTTLVRTLNTAPTLTLPKIRLEEDKYKRFAKSLLKEKEWKNKFEEIYNDFRGQALIAVLKGEAIRALTKSKPSNPQLVNVGNSTMSSNLGTSTAPVEGESEDAAIESPNDTSKCINYNDAVTGKRIRKSADSNGAPFAAKRSPPRMRKESTA